MGYPRRTKALNPKADKARPAPNTTLSQARLRLSELHVKLRRSRGQSSAEQRDAIAQNSGLGPIGSTRGWELRLATPGGTAHKPRLRTNSKIPTGPLPKGLRPRVRPGLRRS